MFSNSFLFENDWLAVGQEGTECIPPPSLNCQSEAHEEVQLYRSSCDTPTCDDYLFKVNNKVACRPAPYCDPHCICTEGFYYDERNFCIPKHKCTTRADAAATY